MLEIAFATEARMPALLFGDAFAATALSRRGARVDAAVWDDPAVDWGRFDAVAIRTCWDYHTRAQEFLAWAEGLAARGVRVLNPPAVLRWNAHKSYLLELARRGVDVVPTAVVERGATAGLAALLEARGWAEAVVKPAVSGGGFETARVSRESPAAAEEALGRVLAHSEALVQPFLAEIASEGEWSLIFFGGEYSHAVRKVPAAGDFRVHQEFGGQVLPEAAPAALISAAAEAARAAGPLLYARVDGIYAGGRFLLMELELIEPELFFGADPDAPERFADALLAFLRQPAHT
jgi:glutathione synthase/RimK-type ligase-like ATP-grasp enzyme